VYDILHRLLYGKLLRKCNIPEGDLEELAADRELWSSTCITGLKCFKAASEQVVSDRRARRHAAAVATPPAGPVCHRCGRICASDFGLCSPTRIHLWPHNWHYISATSLSKSSDKQALAVYSHWVANCTACSGCPRLKIMFVRMCFMVSELWAVSEIPLGHLSKYWYVIMSHDKSSQIPWDVPLKWVDVPKCVHWVKMCKAWK